MNEIAPVKCFHTLNKDTLALVNQDFHRGFFVVSAILLQLEGGPPHIGVTVKCNVLFVPPTFMEYIDLPYDAFYYTGSPTDMYRNLRPLFDTMYADIMMRLIPHGSC